MKLHIQGELAIKEINELPNGASLIKEASNEILAHSESGHHHVLEAPTKFKVYELDGNTYLDIESTSSLVHKKTGKDAHKTQTIKKGLYKIHIKKEYNLYEKVMRKVRD